MSDYNCTITERNKPESLFDSKINWAYCKQFIVRNKIHHIPKNKK